LESHFDVLLVLVSPDPFVGASLPCAKLTPEAQHRMMIAWPLGKESTNACANVGREASSIPVAKKARTSLHLACFRANRAAAAEV
jgi:hypothetical protein